MISDRELNLLKRQNYGTMTAKPKFFNTKVIKMNEDIKGVDKNFCRVSQKKKINQ